MKILGYPVTFKRKRFGNGATGETYTQSSVTIDGAKHLLSDGLWYKGKQPSVADLERSVAYLLEILAADDPEEAADKKLTAELIALSEKWKAEKALVGKKNTPLPASPPVVDAPTAAELDAIGEKWQRAIEKVRGELN
jgi:hypothetical protein